MRICRVRVEEKEEFLVYTVLWTLTCHPYLESATALSDIVRSINAVFILCDHRVCPCACAPNDRFNLVCSLFAR